MPGRNCRILQYETRSTKYLIRTMRSSPRIGEARRFLSFGPLW
jgi:hypothetical protein